MNLRSIFNRNLIKRTNSLSWMCGTRQSSTEILQTLPNSADDDKISNAVEVSVSHYKNL